MTQKILEKRIIEEELNNLIFLKNLLEKEDVYFIEELEIDPFNKFSIEFSAVYWYIKYHLLRDKKVKVDNEMTALFVENDINIIWLTLTDNNTFKIRCIDGDTWELEIFEYNHQIAEFLNKYKTTIKPAANK